MFFRKCKDYAGLDLEDHTTHSRIVGPPIFLLAGRRESRRKRTEADLFGDAFDDDELAKALIDQDAVRIRRQVFRLARVLTGAEVEGVLEPQAMHAHRVGPSIRTYGNDHIIVRIGEPLLCPAPIKHSLR